MKAISRREMIKDALAIPAAALISGKSAGFSVPAGSFKLADFGWSWEGQGFTGEPHISIYGLGEGAEYFRLKKVFNLYRPNDDLAMEKLNSFTEIICEISPDRPIRCGERCVQLSYEPSPAKFLEGARNVSRLSLKYPIIKGAYIDDTLGGPKQGTITRELYAAIYNALKKDNPNLKLWALVYSNQLDQQDWDGFDLHMDVINLWVWESQDLMKLDRYVDRAREVFHGKPLIVGIFLWDYASMKYSQGDFVKGHAFPMDLLKWQWNRILSYLETHKIDGYTILGAYEIDSAPEQARWIRDFIAAH